MTLIVFVALFSMIAVVPAPALGGFRKPSDASESTRASSRPLSDHRRGVDIDSTFGSGSFGRWTVDRFGLPAYRYTMDEETDPRAVQPELSGRQGEWAQRDAWHQVGNDHLTAIAHNHGYVELWSMDRLYQWTNLYDAPSHHFSGGYGYLNAGGRVISTLYDDRPVGAATEREFGIGYVRKRLSHRGLDVEEFVYAPFGDDAILLHDVSITNTSTKTRRPTWFEYWDVNPVIQTAGPRSRGHLSPTYDADLRTLVVDQLPADGDREPLSIFATALSGPVAGFDTDTEAFFGSGDPVEARAEPDAVRNNVSSGSIAPPALPGVPGDGVPRRAMFAFRAPLKLKPNETVRLRYAYGSTHREDIEPLVDRYRTDADPLGDSMRAWADWVPKLELPMDEPWVARELQWNAYRVRSAAAFEEECGYHIVPEGGYYLYAQATQGVFRDPLQYSLSLIYTHPELTREVIRYSAQEQPQGTGIVPFQMVQLCRRNDLGNSADLDFWLLLAASEYALATRDFDFFDEVVPYAGGTGVRTGAGTIWEHLKLAHFHQENIVGRGPHGGYLAQTMGDWADLSPQFMQMTESLLVTAQLAYVYPRLALVADARGDREFAAELRTDAEELLQTLRREWTGRWFPRGYAGDKKLGTGAIFSEPQPWALLAGAATAEQAKTVVENIRRFLTGIGAPPEVRGPSPIGSAQSPACYDPHVEEFSGGDPTCDVDSSGQAGFGSGGENAVYVGGSWFALNGHLVWALASLDGVVSGAKEYAWDEYLRNTLANHADVYPDHWGGIISVDDMCWSWYSPRPERCGLALPGFDTYNTQNTHQPAWNVWGAIQLAGITATKQGYRIDPHFPFEDYSLRLPLIGVAAEPCGLRGYVQPEDPGGVLLEVAIPEGAAGVRAFVESRPVDAHVANGVATFTVPTTAVAATHWAVTWRCR